MPRVIQGGRSRFRGEATIPLRSLHGCTGIRRAGRPPCPQNQRPALRAGKVLIRPRWMRRRLRPMGLRSTLCCDLTTLPARSASAALRGGAPPPVPCRSLGRPLSAGAVSGDRLPHAARQSSLGTMRQSVLRAVRASPTPLRDVAPPSPPCRCTPTARRWLAVSDDFRTLNRESFATSGRA